MRIKISEIKVDKSDANTRRVRKQLGDVTQLADSITRHGLLHPIVVDRLYEPLFLWRLIAGERRLRACILNGAIEIEANLLNDIDDVGAKEIELEENVVRQDLSWPEECEALRQLNELKVLKYGKAQPSRYASEKDGWKLEDTADAVGMSRSSVSEDIKLAERLRERPKLAKKVKKLPKSAARKIVKLALEAEMLKKQLANKEITLSSNLMLGDACDLIDTLEDESVRLLLTDPPFGIQDIVDMGTAGAMTYNIVSDENVSTEDKMRKVYLKLLPKIFKKLIPGSHIYVFLGMGWYCELISLLRRTGFVVDDLPIIWYKGRPSVIAKDNHYTSSYEAILFGHKPPNPRILSKPINNMISVPTIAPQKRVHPLQKPFDLLKIFIENSTSVGELVLDCFSGSASTLIAAEKLQRSAVGFELDTANYQRAQKYMEKELRK